MVIYTLQFEVSENSFLKAEILKKNLGIWQTDGDNCLMQSFTVSTDHLVLLNKPLKEKTKFEHGIWKSPSLDRIWCYFPLPPNFMLILSFHFSLFLSLSRAVKKCPIKILALIFMSLTLILWPTRRLALFIFNSLLNVNVLVLLNIRTVMKWKQFHASERMRTENWKL